MKDTNLSKPTLIVGGTGRVGSRIIELLTERGHAVRALVRSTESAARLPGNCEAVLGDLADTNSLADAVRNVGSACIAISDHPNQVTLEGNLIDALGGDVNMVKISAFAAGLEPPPGYGRIHRAIEKRLEKSALRWTVLRPYAYMQNFLEMADAVRNLRALPFPLAQARVAFIDARDVALAAVAVMEDPQHAGKTYVLTGPESCSGADVAERLSDNLGKKIRYAATPQWMANFLMRLSGVSRWDIRMRAELFRMLRDNGEAETTDCLQELTGRRGMAMYDFFSDHHAHFTG